MRRCATSRASRVKISVVELKGLDVDVPPKTHFTHRPSPENAEEHGTPLLRFEVESIDCDGAHLTLETDKPGKLPLEFEIAHIKLNHVRRGRAHAVRRGADQSQAGGNDCDDWRMGPWMVDDPGETPLSGSYRFEHADLGVFKGIAGILQSTGKYEGVLRDLVVDGQTDTPDFRLTNFGTAVPLHTEFHAHVDGTNGDTWLEPVNATLGQSHFTARGQGGARARREPRAMASATPGGHVIALKVNVNGGRMEDFLRLQARTERRC